MWRSAAPKLGKVASARHLALATAAWGVAAVQENGTLTPAPSVPLPLAVVEDVVADTDCLGWFGDGCGSINSRDLCVSSRDGSAWGQLQGRKVFGEPCLWCGGKSCEPGNAELCIPVSLVVGNLSSGSEEANCSSGQGSVSWISWEDGIQKEVSNSAGAVRRNVSFEPKLMDGPASVGQACRHVSVADGRTQDAAGKNYYSTWTAQSLEECFELCRWRFDCTGVEFMPANSYCEIWNAGIGWSQAVANYSCYTARRLEEVISASEMAAVVPEATSATPQNASKSTAQGDWVWVAGAGALCVLAALALFLFLYSRSSNKKKLVKRAIDMRLKKASDAAAVESAGSGDETAPLVNSRFNSGVGGFPGAVPQQGFFQQMSLLPALMPNMGFGGMGPPRAVPGQNLYQPLAVAPVDHAQEAGRRDLFSMYDTDGDGVISRQEFIQAQYAAQQPRLPDQQYAQQLQQYALQQQHQHQQQQQQYQQDQQQQQYMLQQHADQQYALQQQELHHRFLQQQQQML